MARELKPCGTRAAYARHLRNDEEPCEPCKQANNRASKSDPRHRPLQRARQRAFIRLSLIYDEAYQALLAEEKAKEGL